MTKISIWACVIVVFTASCTLGPKPQLTEFPLSKGTTWTYTYETYNSSASDPTQIAKATYQLTESVTNVESDSTYLVVHINRDFKLTHADSGWLDNSSEFPEEFWFVVSNQQVYQSEQTLDEVHLNKDDLSLAYEFPLALGNSWCLAAKNSADAAGCEFVSKRAVIDQAPYNTETVNFTDCYDLIDYYNGGNFFQKFCNGVGLVSLKFDHAGSRFGFEQNLIQYSAGVP